MVLHRLVELARRIRSWPGAAGFMAGYGRGEVGTGAPSQSIAVLPGDADGYLMWGLFLKREGCDALAAIFVGGFLHKKTTGSLICRPFMPFGYRRNLPVSATV